MTDTVSPSDGMPPSRGVFADIDAADEALAAELRRAGALADPVPEAWRAEAGEAYDWLEAPGEPARLVYDARVADGEPSWRAVAAAGRSLRFVAEGWGSDTVIEVELDVRDDTVTVRGRLRPVRSAAVTAAVDDARTTTEADDRGAFGLGDLPLRPFYLLVGGVMACKTAWIVP